MDALGKYVSQGWLTAFSSATYCPALPLSALWPLLHISLLRCCCYCYRCQYMQASSATRLSASCGRLIRDCICRFLHELAPIGSPTLVAIQHNHHDDSNSLDRRPGRFKPKEAAALPPMICFIVYLLDHSVVRLLSRCWLVAILIPWSSLVNADSVTQRHFCIGGLQNRVGMD